ncbi:hypothetical protein KR054_005600 [Drosophila jambulina]|nr:hypothetical protein KR054_005600 [Drosophila jambulina]
MSVMQCGARSLLFQGKLATTTITHVRHHVYDKEKKLELRKRRQAAMKPSNQVPCYKALNRSENRCNQPRLKEMLSLECIDDPCGLAPMPIDLENYTPSDKKQRKYQRTWCECFVLPTKFVNPKKSYPNRPRRQLRQIASSGECVEVENVAGKSRKKPERLIDVKKLEWPCCKIAAPGCKPARPDPKCSPFFPPSCCKKRRTQYPSFSECQPEGLLDPIPPCECEKQANMCDVWAYWRRFHDK